MKTRLLFAAMAITAVLTGLQIVACLGGPAGAILGGIVLALLSHWLLRFFDLEIDTLWGYLAIPVIASLAAAAILIAGTGQSWRTGLWFGPVAAAVTAILRRLVARRGSRQCGLCSRRLGNDLAFTCPRCRLLVCERNCWVYERLRCRLCEQNRVILFDRTPQWWSTHFGPVARYGRCEHCKQAAGEEATPAELNLRACRHCGRFQCQDCWDYLNGQCVRCGWTVPALPEELKNLLKPAAQDTQNHSHA